MCAEKCPFYSVTSRDQSTPAVRVIAPRFGSTSQAGKTQSGATARGEIHRCPDREISDQVEISAGRLDSKTSSSADVEKTGSASGEKKPTYRLVFERGNEAPVGLYKGTIASHHDVIYCSSLGSDVVYKYSIASLQWQTLPVCPSAASALAVVAGVLTAVGGEMCSANGKRFPTNAVHSFKDSGGEGATAWGVCYPPMPTKRSYCTAVSYQDALIVAGGQTTYVQSGHCLTTVDVLNTQTAVWFRASPLPWPVRSPSTVIHDSLLYLAGGWDDSGGRVAKCDLNLLRKSCKPLSGSRNCKIGDYQVTVWEEMPSAPVYSSSCAVVGGHLLLLGGRGERGRVTSAVHMYTASEGGEEGGGGWREVGAIPGEALHHCLCARVSSGEVMVMVGGLSGRGVATSSLWTGRFKSTDNQS